MRTNSTRGIQQRRGKYVIQWRHEGRIRTKSYATLREAKHAKEFRDAGYTDPALDHRRSRESRWEHYEAALRLLDQASSEIALAFDDPAAGLLHLANSLAEDRRKFRRKYRQREAVPTATRLTVLRRDNFRCLVCGSEDELTIDHIMPVSAGGGNAIENLQTLCWPCNRSKGKKIPASVDAAASPREPGATGRIAP